MILQLEIADLCTDSEIDLDSAYLESILKAYEGRPYHNAKHIEDMFDQLGNILWKFDFGLLNTMENYLPVAWAILYHDIVYGVENSELASAARLRRDLTGKVDKDIIDEAYRLILVTKDHVYEKNDFRAALICDADLAILSSSPQKYREYAKAIRQEYASVDEDLFRSARIEVLTAILRRPSIYGLADDWEATARTNLKEEIGALRSTPWYESNPPL